MASNVFDENFESDRDGLGEIEALAVKGVVSANTSTDNSYWSWTVDKPEELPEHPVQQYENHNELRWYPSRG